MRVRMLRNLAGPEYAAHAGQVIDLDDAHATALIDKGQAEPPEARADRLKAEKRAGKPKRQEAELGA